MKKALVSKFDSNEAIFIKQQTRNLKTSKQMKEKKGIEFSSLLKTIGK